MPGHAGLLQTRVIPVDPNTQGHSHLYG
ncbi:hypothetical protein CBM2585_B50126 [Cupriavidus taiwanensis]|nr:hypothetical protein CBM2585_B50126 [Cupriavidus taiwanensis]